MEKKILALFDFDGTMIHGDSIVPYLAFARRRGDVSLPGYLKSCFYGVLFAMKLMDGGKAKTKALAFYQRLSPAQRQALDQAFWEGYLMPRVYPRARAAVERHGALGHHRLLVSASTENYMQYVARALGFDGLLCTSVDEKGTVGRNCHGEEKVRRIRAYLAQQGIQPDFPASFAYGDSRGDLPMLRLCGHPIQANPKPALREAAPEMEYVIWAEQGLK